MASHAHKLPEFGDPSGLYGVQHTFDSVNAAQLRQSSKRTPVIEIVSAANYEDSSLVRGVCVALTLEAVGGIALYLVWSLLHTIR